MEMSLASLTEKIRDVPDFPHKGVVFKDITTLLKDSRAFKMAIDGLIEPFRGTQIDLVVGMESRGFILGSPIAYQLGAGFVPVRKVGKLPASAIRAEYTLEYGTAALEIHEDAIVPGQKVLVVDDLLATGGTVGATIDLIEKLRGEVVGVAFLIELTFLNGRSKLHERRVVSLLQY